MKKLYLLLTTSFLLSFSLLTAQVSITGVSTPVTIDFSGFTGSGVIPNPASGELDSDDWSFDGFSTGTAAFGSTNTSGDYARGTTAGGVGGGGLYSQVDTSGNAKMWIQPTGSDFTPGTATLRIQNNTGSPMNSLDVSYNIYVLNDQGRANSFNFSWSADSSNFTSVPALDYTSPEASTGGTSVESRSTSIVGLNIADGDFFYIRWEGNDVSGGGSRDEFGLDDIVVEIPGGPVSPAFNFSTSFQSVNENTAGMVTVTVDITTSADCSIEVALDGSSTASFGSDFSFTNPTTLNFTSGGATSQSFSITVIDDMDLESTETIVLNLQNSGGTGGCIVGAQSQQTIEIDDDESAPMGECLNLFFSEYIEGSSNNKAIEIYNPTSGTVDLSNYTVNIYANGSSTPTGSLTPIGMLDSGDVFMIANANADSALLSLADTTSTVTFYNGDDALALFNAGDMIDVIGEIGTDPGTNWPVGTGATSEHTLVRKAAVKEGTTVWSTGQTQWDVFPQNTFSNWGSHTTIACGVSLTEFNFASPSGSVTEGDDSVAVDVVISMPANCSVDVSVSATSTATNGSDFTFTSPTTLTFTSGGSDTMTIQVPVTDDFTAEPDEFIVLTLSNATGSCSVGNVDTTSITLLDNDYPFFDIEELRTVDSTGVVDSLNVRAEVEGLVYGVDLRGGTGLQFVVHDGTAGIVVFSFADFGYTVNEGDFVRVQGTVTQFNGLAEIIPDTVILLSAGNPIPVPSVVASLGENTESELITLKGVRLIDASQWTNSGSGFNLDITNNVDTFSMRIDADVDIYGTLPPGTYFNLIGLGGQFDSSSPFTEGYQILPRYMSDIDPIQPSSCLKDGYENNDTQGTAAQLVGSAVAGFGNMLICPQGDVDWYSFPVPAGANFSLTLNQLPDNYDLELHNSGGLVTSSNNGGTDAEVINVSGASGGTYFARVAGVSGASHSGQSYALTLNFTQAPPAGTTGTKPIIQSPIFRQGAVENQMSLFPNPSSGLVSLELQSNVEGNAHIQLTDMAGRIVMAQNASIAEGNNSLQLQLSELAAGSYQLSVKTESAYWVEKLLLTKE